MILYRELPIAHDSATAHSLLLNNFTAGTFVTRISLEPKS